MARKRRKSASRRTRSMSEPGRRRSTRRKTSRRRHRGGLREIMTPAGAMAAGRGVLGGAAGGIGAGIVRKAAANLPTLGRVGVGLLGSALIYGVLGWQNVGAGFAGGYAALETQGMAGLQEGHPYADPDALNQLPPVLNENGEPLTLMEDEQTGDVLFLDEATGETYLAEEIYPSYARA